MSFTRQTPRRQKNVAASQGGTKALVLKKKVQGMQSLENLMVATPSTSSRKKTFIGPVPIIDAASMTGSQSQSLAAFGSDAKIAHSVLTQHQIRQ